MTEILTESFCERCGTRYSFESAGPRRSRVGRVRMLSRGVRNYVMSDGTSFSEALADARSVDEISATAHQLDAFHKTFNFCLTCRQYTCGNCWNDAEGRCLTCAPVPGEELVEPIMMLAVAEAPASVGPSETAEDVAVDATPGAWPEADLTAARLARVLGVDAPRVDDEAEPASDGGARSESEAEAADGVELELELDEVDEAVLARLGDGGQAEAVAEAGPIPDTIEQEAAAVVVPAAGVVEEPRLRGIEPGQSVEAAVAAYEAQLAAEEAEARAVPDREAVAAGDTVAVDHVMEQSPEAAEVIEAIEPEAPEADVVAPEDDAVAAVVAEAPPEVPEAVEVAPEAIEPEPEAVEVAPEAVKPQPEAIEPEPRPEPAPESIAASAPVEPSAPVRDDVIVQPTWPVSAPEAASQVPQPPAAPPAPPAPPAPASAAPWLTVAPETGAGPEPQWSQVPIQGRFGANAGAAPAPAGSIVPHGDPAALWAASAREVLSGGPRPVQPAITSTPTPQPCISCGLPLSASARFCRRCGSRQG